MVPRRVSRLNSLLKEVISDVIKRQVKDPNVSEMVTVTKVEITKDLRHAKVFVSIFCEELEKKQTLRALSSASGFIGTRSSKEVVMHHFPELTFHLDRSVEHYTEINNILKSLKKDD